MRGSLEAIVVAVAAYMAYRIFSAMGATNYAKATALLWSAKNPMTPQEAASLYPGQSTWQVGPEAGTPIIEIPGQTTNPQASGLIGGG